jgi:phosphonate transport system substrate-binding protein
MSSTYILTYYPWITQHKTPEEIRAQVQIFATELQNEINTAGQINCVVQLAPAMEVPDQIQSIVAGTSQIALMNPLGFVYARRRNPEINAAVVALRIIDNRVGNTYFAQIYTHIDRNIKRLADLKQRSFGYGSVQSTSNFIIPAFDMKSAAIHPFAAFKRVEFEGGHDTVAVAVYKGIVDAGAGHDGVIIDLSNTPGYEDAKEKLITIHRSDPIPSDPVAVFINDKSQYDTIQKALVSISNKSPAKEAIAGFWGNAQGLEATTYAPYDYLIKAVSELGLTEQDIFPAKA